MQETCQHLNSFSGFCVWYRRKGWTKVWSSVIGFDIFNWAEDEQKPEDLVIQFSGSGWDGVRYKKTDIYPFKHALLEGIKVVIPNNPEGFLDTTYGKGKWEEPLKCTKINEDMKCVE